MEFFSSVKDNFAKGFDWGVDAATQTASQVKSGVVAGYEAGRDGLVYGYEAVKGGVVSGYETVRDGVVSGSRAAVGSLTVAAASGGGNYLTSNSQRESAIKKAVDKRPEYRSKEVCQACEGGSAPSHPNANDGKFMGADCIVTATKPSTGKLPKGCGPGCKLPKIYFTNGINNDEKQVCQTLTAIAEMQCAEVVGIYNATYADSAKVAAPGATPWKAPARPDPPWYRPDQLVAAAVGDKLDAIQHAAAERAGATGLMMDVLDCLDNIDSAGTEAAAATQKNLLFDALSAEPPQPVTLYAHSQGGLITQEGLVMARQKLYATRYAKLVADGAADPVADASAARYADERMKMVQVTSFGTAESGWTPGPGYSHYTNSRDPVPALIRSVQANRLIDTSKTGGPVDRFTASPALDPMAAHSMAEAYLPEFAKQHTAKRVSGKCCD